MRDRIVYTAIAGGYDELKRLPRSISGSFTCIAFLDDFTRDRTVDPGGWVIEPLVSDDPTPLLRAKRSKVLADHVLLSGPGESLWIDGSIRISEDLDLDRSFDEVLAGHDLAFFRHPRRNCVYSEADTCIRLGLDDPTVISRQVAGYHREGYPVSNGLAMGGIIFRRNTFTIGEFNSRWWAEILAGSTRDQLSLDPVAWRMGLLYNHMSPDRVGCESRDPGGNAFLPRPHGRIDFRSSVHVRGRSAA